MTDLPPFIHGLELCERFFEEAVDPILEAHYPSLKYSAGHLERGSDVLGYDTERSRDHHWGPKVTLFLPEADLDSVGPSIMDLMARELPFEVAGYPTHYDKPETDGGFLKYRTERPINHGVTVSSIEEFTAEYLGIDATQEIGARQIIELMRLAFLMEREYAPYSKWFGTAFARLECADDLNPIFHEVLNAREWREREAGLNKSYLQLGEMHNRLGVAEPVEVRIAPFHGRPYLVPHSERFVTALHGVVKSPGVRSLPRDVGGIFQFVDSTDVQDSEGNVLLRSLMGIYDS